MQKVKQILKGLYDRRKTETNVSTSYLADCENVIDFACGAGTFLKHFKKRAIGLDINRVNVSYCQQQNMDAIVGSALSIPFADNSFDGYHSSHVMQCFTPSEAVIYLREAARVVTPGGIIVISTLNWFKRFFRHPENVRPYPPDSIRRYSWAQVPGTSPMYEDLPVFKEEAIWRRRTPLINLDYYSQNLTFNRVQYFLNLIQYALFFRNYFSYDSYIIKLRNCKTL